MTGLCDKKRFERHVAVVLIVRRKDYPERARVQLDDLIVARFAHESHPVGDAERLGGQGLERLRLRARAGDDELDGREAYAPSPESPDRRA